MLACQPPHRQALSGNAKVVRPTGFEPATFGSGAGRKEDTWGSVRPLPQCFRALVDHPRQPGNSPKRHRLSAICQSDEVSAGCRSPATFGRRRHTYASMGVEFAGSRNSVRRMGGHPLAAGRAISWRPRLQGAHCGHDSPIGRLGAQVFHSHHIFLRAVRNVVQSAEFHVMCLFPSSSGYC